MSSISSQRRNIDQFIQTKNQEIKSLKQKILGTKITTEDIETAKSKLSCLKSAHHELEREDHLELKQMLQSSHSTLSEFGKKKNKCQEDCAALEKRSIQLAILHQELASKKAKTEQFYKQGCEAKEKLLDKKQRKKNQIRQIQDQIQTRNRQLSMERQIGLELEVAKEEIKGKLQIINKDLVQIAEENKTKMEAIRTQLQQITQLEHNLECSSLKMQALQLKLQCEQKSSQISQLKIEAAHSILQKYSQDKLIHLKQSQTQENIDTLLNMCKENNQKKQRQQKQCQQEISQLEGKIKLMLCKRTHLMKQMQVKKDNLKEIKQKGAELKNLLNSIFHQDSSVLKLLADKKVYESQSEVAKKSNHEGLELKKYDSLQSKGTAESFYSAY